MHNLTHRITSIKETRSLCLAQIIFFSLGTGTWIKKKIHINCMPFISLSVWKAWVLMCSSHAESKIFCVFFQTQLIFIEKEARTPLGL